MEGIIAAVITSVLGLAGVIVTNVSGNKKIEAQLKTSQAVTDCKLDELTREVREHNNFAQRIPVIEERINGLDRRVGEIENFSKQWQG